MLERGKHALKHDHKSSAAGIDDICLLEYRKQVGCSVQYIDALFDNVIKESLDIAEAVLLCFLHCLLGAYSHDLEDRTLGRCHDSLVGFRHTCLERLWHLNGTCFFEI